MHTHDSVHQTRELTHVTGTNWPWLDVQTSVDIFESSQIEGLCVRDSVCVCVCVCVHLVSSLDFQL